MSCRPSSVYAPRRPQALSTEQYYYIKNVLRSQKARYEAIADRHRAELRVTSHARSLARALNLNINTPRAVSCPQRYVSVEPLPIIDDSVHPGSPPVHAASEELYPEIPRLHSYNTRQWYTGRCCAPIDVPVEETGRSLMEDIELDSPSSESSGESSHSSAFTSSSDSSSSSLMYAPSTESSLMTPDSSPLMIRIKRKSTLNEDYYHSAVKQPRYLRKSWVQPIRYA